MKRVIMVVSDGLWSGELGGIDCRTLAPVIEGGTRCAKHSGAIPSVTRVSAASIVTGCRPAKHGLFGNRIALPRAAGGLEVHDVGRPEFFAAVREVTGRVLKLPTLAELIAPLGPFLAFSNVSPGAAYILDPEHAGYVFHRAGSFGPGGTVLDGERALKVAKGPEGDRAMTTRFLEELERVDPPLSILWLGEPDTSLHLEAPGSDLAREGIRSACDCIMRVRERALTFQSDGDEVLFLVGSDHGMDPVDRVAGVEDELIRAGFKRDREDPSLVVAANGGSALIALADPEPAFVASLVRFVKARPWALEVYAEHGPADGGLASIGLAEDPCLAVFVNAAFTGESSKGSGQALRWSLERYGDIDRIAGKGMHGFSSGLSMQPYLIVEGGSFPRGLIHEGATSLIDIAPTILRHFGLETPHWMDSVALQERIVQGAQS